MELINLTSLQYAPIVGRIGFPKHSLTLIVKGTFDLVHNGSASISEDQFFPTGDELYPDDDEGDGSHFYGSDFAYFKPRADLLLSGKCCSPGGQPIQACKVTFGVGARSKTLGVFGNRYWSQITKTISDPQPFTEMELRYENSFGGEGFKKNPVGKGYGTLKDTDGTTKWPLPNIEDLKHLVDSPKSQPEPAGFGPVDSLWPQRYAKMGTYKGAWLKERWPWYPTDFDWGYYNGAPADMQVEGYLKGDESLYFENLHSSISRYQSRLPGLRPRLFIQKQGAAKQDEPVFFEPDLKLDTLWVDMEAEKLVLVWRAVIEVLSEDYDEIEHVFMAGESMDDSRKTQEYYHNHFLKRVEQEDEVTSDGITADEEVFSETEDVDIDEEIKKVEAEIREACIEAGIDPDREIPQPTEDDKQEEARILKEMGFEPDVEEIPITREMIIDRITKGEGFCGEDLSNMDLSGLDMEGVDFSDAILDGANFEKSILTKADFTNSTLQKANLLSAELKGTVLKDANLTQALLTGANLSGADIQDTIFDQASLQSALFESCNAENASFYESDLTAASFKNAQIRAADFSKSTLIDANFHGASLTEASVEDADGVRINMKKANLSGLKASGKTNFSKGCFRGVVAPYSIWEGAILDEADFSMSSMEGANFASASLKSAVFVGSDLKYARLSKADLYQARCMSMNLFEANLEKADLTLTDFRASNIYGAEFLDAVIDRTMFGNANLKMTKLSKK
jgi:uncharacterized protein YjbI with pentapeptide repeats